MRSEQEIRERLENHRERYDVAKHVGGKVEHEKTASMIHELEWVLEE